MPDNVKERAALSSHQSTYNIQGSGKNIIDFCLKFSFDLIKSRAHAGGVGGFEVTKGEFLIILAIYDS